MNKIGVVLGVAAMTVLAGCLDPDYKGNKKTHFEPTAPQPTTPAETYEQTTVVDDTQPLVIEEVETPVSPVTKDQVKPVETKPVVVNQPPAKPESTPYIVQRGDTLSKLSKRYNITIAAIKRANPQIKGDTIRLGQRIQLPGKVEVGEQTVPDGAFAKPAPKTPVVVGPYTGATTDYVIQKGDYLGKIAAKHGCTVRQLKDLNGMADDRVVIGKKIKVPAGKAAPVVKAAPAPAKAEVKSKPAAAPAKSAPVAKPVEKKPATPAPDPVATPEPAPAADEQPVEETASAPAVTPSEKKYINYTVQEGDDLTGIAINFDAVVSEIRQINNLSDDAKVTPGMVLKIPPEPVVP